MSERWQHVKAIFQDALDRHPAERASLVAARCGEDDGLRAEVMSLLASHHAAGDLIETPAASVVTPASSRFSPGRVIGQYRLQSEIGRGGMGAVYQAVRADDVFQKRVAIKVIKQGMDTEEIVRRFRRERRTLGSLEHPHIARVLDGGSTEEGAPYFVMEFVDGIPVDEYCEAKRLGIRERIQLFRAISDAVDYAHQNLVVHRDIKPDNVLVATDGVPKLLDFGIARMLTHEGVPAGTVAVTRPAERLMTLEYASPELLRGDAITTMVDEYALGVMLYDLLACRHPFRDHFANAAALERAIQAPHVPPPSQVAEPPGADAGTTREWRRRLGGDLDTIVAKAMHPDPRRRYASVRALSDDLARHLDGLPVTARPDTWPYLAGKFVRRHAAAVAGVVALVVTLLVAAVILAWQGQVVRAERDRARNEADKAERISAVLQNMLRAADPAQAGKDVTVASVLDEAVRRIDAELAAQPEVAAAVRQAVGNTYASLGRYQAAETQLRRALETRLATPDVGARDVAMTRSDLAGVLAEAGQIQPAEAEYRAALAAIDAGAQVSPRDHAAVLDGLGQLLRHRGEDAGARGALSQALAIRRADPAASSEDIAESLNSLAVLHQSRAELGQAEPLFREALTFIRKAHPDDYPGTAITLGNLANVLHSAGRLDDAERMYRESLDMRLRLLGDGHPGVQVTRFNYSDLLAQRGRHDDAIAMSDAILAQRGTTLPDSHPVLAAAYQGRGRSLMARGRLKQAEADLREARRLRLANLPPGHWQTAFTESTLGECLLRQGRAAEAAPLIRTSYERLLADRGPDHERTREAKERVMLLAQPEARPD